jgi:MFS superfamily sulfate permease-like transporter
LWGLEGWGVFAAGVAVLLCLRRRWQWAAVGLLLLGILAAAVREPALLSAWRVSLWRPGVAPLHASAISGIWRGGLAQLPLTLLNSVFAASLLAGWLFPAAGNRATPRRLALSVALMNLIACPLGGMPTCHGSGGLASQVRFGARTGLSMVMLGAAKLALGLLFGATALVWMRAFPVTMLGVFLFAAGAALARASGFWRSQQVLLTAAVTVGVYLGSGSLPAGFAAGWVAHALLTRAAARETRKAAGAGGAR